MCIAFTVEMIHEIHREIIDTFRELAQRNGGDEIGIVYDVRDQATLDFIVMTINLAPTSVEQAAVALHRIASQHPYLEATSGRPSSLPRPSSGKTVAYLKVRSPTTNSS